MNLKNYSNMMDLLYRPIYAFYKAKDYDFSTLEDGEIFLSYANNFNDLFEGSVEINENEFRDAYLLKLVGDDLFKEINEKLRFCKNWNCLSGLCLYWRPNNIEIPSHISDKLRKIILENNWERIESKARKKYNAYCREVRRVRNSYGIKCFTLNSPEKSSVMWAHYANNYKGIACCFSLEQAVYDISSIRCDEYGKTICEHFGKVKYKKNFAPTIKINCEKLLKIPINMVYQSEYINHCVREALLIKQSQWKHENEIRLIIRDNESNVQITSKKKRGFKIKFPYLKDIYFCSKKENLFFRYQINSALYNKVKHLSEIQHSHIIFLTPSSEKMEFEIKNDYDNEHPIPIINYTDDDIPF